MFKENKYSKAYFRIIEIAKARKKKGYTESHHIIPSCLGGSDSKENRVDLTAREHFIVHLLLTKMSDDHRLKFALVMMMAINPEQKHERYLVKTSRLFEYVKICNAEASRLRNKNRSYSKGYVIAISPEGKTSRFYSPNDIPSGWVRGNKGKGRKGTNKGKIYAFDPQTRSAKSFDSLTLIPEGWHLGNPNASKAGATAKIKGKTYFHNPITGKEVREENSPGIDWVAGRVCRWITNGLQNIQHNIAYPIPNGFRFGRTNKSGHKQNRKKNDI